MNLTMKFPEGRSKALTLSYDDGVIHDIPMVEILDRYGIKCTFNVNSGRFSLGETDRPETNKKLTLEGARDLYVPSPHEIAVHTLTHPSLSKLRADEIVCEVMEDRKKIEQEFGRIARGMAYPYGHYSDRVLSVLETCGIVYSRTVKSTLSFDLPENFLAWHPTCHHNHPEMMNLAKKFITTSPKRYFENWVFYLWGHSYEFDRDNNWELLENFCKFCGRKEDVWYCTNIELYDYVKAYENLVCSADNSVVFNPSATTVHFLRGKEPFQIRGGETLSFN